jgi:hypothetical protein
VARQQIQPSLGATSYNFSPEALQNIPQGENAPLNQVLLQAPGVAQDSFCQIHLRGEHANVQFRLNGVELPEGLSVFGQVIATPTWPTRPRPNSRVTRGHFDQTAPRTAVAEHVAMILTFATNLCDTENDGIP